MYTYNARINDDSKDEEHLQSVLLRFSQQKSLTVLVSKLLQTGSYVVDVNVESDMKDIKERQVLFDAHGTGFRIQAKTKEDVELLSAALNSIGTVLEMMQDDHVPESISSVVIGHRNKVDNIFDKQGEPYLIEHLFDEQGGIIKPENQFDSVVPMLRAKGSQREFNHLRIKNLNYFLDTYGNNTAYYESPFSILAALERQIKFEDLPETTICVSYKPDGEVIFRQTGIFYNGSVRIVEYEFDTTIS